jgi:hypothetical protein
MQDRLGDLRRQREMIAGHLRWLDRAIAECEGTEKDSAPSSLLSPPAAVVPIAATSPHPGSAATPDAPFQVVSDAGTAVPPPQSPVAAVIAAELPSIDPGQVKTRTRWGCFFYMLLAALALAGGTWLLISLSRCSALRSPTPAHAEQSAPKGP